METLKFLFTLLLIIPPGRRRFAGAYASFDNAGTTSAGHPPDPQPPRVAFQSAEGQQPRRGCGDNVAPHRVTHAEGVVEWTGSENAMTCTWVIDVTSSGQGSLVLHFDEVRLKRGTKAEEDDTVTMYRGQQPDANQELQRVQGSLPVPPVLVRSQTVVVTVVAYGQKGAHEWTNKLSTEESRFSLRYTAYPANSLPPKLASGRYDCSQPYDVPEALRCDLVEQCEKGEDERDFNCAYRHRDCDDWIPYGDFCLKFVFPDHPISPVQAQSECRNLRNWTRLAALPDSESKLLASRVTSLNGHSDIIVGLEKAVGYFEEEHYLYRFLWKWTFYRRYSFSEFEGPYLSLQGPNLNCATLRIIPAPHFKAVVCSRNVRAGYACMAGKSEPNSPRQPETYFTYPLVSKPMDRIPLKKCPDGSFVQEFHRCFAVSSEAEDGNNMYDFYDSKTRLLECKNGRNVPYTYFCDGYDDCGDESDEPLCRVTEASLLTHLFFVCKRSGETIVAERRCDGVLDCKDLSDERHCKVCNRGTVYFTEVGCLPKSYGQYGMERYQQLSSTRCNNVDKSDFNDELVRKTLTKVIPQTAMRVLTLDGFGTATLKFTDEKHCPETHFACPKGLCIPSYLMLTHLKDCPFPFLEYKYDHNFTKAACPGYYRCAGSRFACLHPDYVCDGVYHCPHRDDERYCNLTCPLNCTCVGFQYTCSQMFDSEQHRFARYLDLSHVSQPPLLGLSSILYLRFLNLSSCDLKTFRAAGMHFFLSVLDLSFNRLVNADAVDLITFSLTHLNLSGNPLVSQLTSYYMSTLFTNLCPFRNELLSLSLAETGIKRIAHHTFQNITSLKVLDVSGNRLKRVDRAAFYGLKRLERLKADDQRLCCGYARLYPEAELACEAPVNELSSCSDLLRSGFLRVALWLQALTALLGNVGTFVFRVFLDTKQKTTGYLVLVANLCVADLLMAIYMIIIGAADARFSGRYLWEQDAWIESAQCKAAGFLALLSTEVSVFVISLVTVDRFLVLRFPFKHHLHMTSRSAMVVCGFAWTVGVSMAVVPLLPFTQHWEFYSQTGICLPLPITRRQFPGHFYSFGVFVVLNFVLFLFIGVGQLTIYRAIRSTPMAGRTQRRQQDTVIARRLFLIVFTDFCCWFPVGVMGLLAARGTPIPGEVNVWTAIFVLPLNSALNPFLYTLNTMFEKHRKQREEKRLQHTMNKLHLELATWPYDKMAELKRYVETAVKRCEPNTTEISGTVTLNEVEIDSA